MQDHKNLIERLREQSFVAIRGGWVLTSALLREAADALRAMDDDRALPKTGKMLLGQNKNRGEAMNRNSTKKCATILLLISMACCMAACAAPQTNQPSSFGSAFDIIKKSKEQCDNYANDFKKQKQICAYGADSECISVLEALAKNMEHCSEDIASGGILASNYDLKRFALTANAICGTQACQAMLETGDAYVRVGDKGKAKRVYREIITTFTGEAYIGYAKKAEFALEDLKDAN